MMDDFDWSFRNERIVIPNQSAIAVYEGGDGFVVIRHEGHYDQSEDALVFVNKAQCAPLAFALLREAGLSSDRPLIPQIAKLCAASPPFDMDEAGRFFEALESELAEEDECAGPIRKSIARMMADRPDIDWLKVQEDATEAGLSDDPEVESEDAAPDKPKDATAAERQRRHRQKKRDEDHKHRDVTRDTVTFNRDMAERARPFALVAAE